MAPDTVEVIAPNLKRRLSGVTATIERLVPVQAKDIGIVATGAGLSAKVPFLPVWRVMTLPRKKRRVWHARRNTEMLLGVFLRATLRKNWALLFTSASQRQHSRYTRWLISKMDHIIATSAKGQAYLTRPSVVVHHGIDTEKFSPTKDMRALRQSLGLPENGKLIGCYGRIRHQKGTDVFVDALIDICGSDPDVHGVILGRATAQHQSFLDGEQAKIETAGLQDRIRIYPEVPVDQVNDWYRALDIYVAPQRWEGFGLTVLEAMACSVPVIATRVGAFEELVRPETGILIAPGEPNEMAQAIRMIQPGMGPAGRKRAVEVFSIEAEAARLNAIYRELL